MCYVIWNRGCDQHTWIMKHHTRGKSRESVINCVFHWDLASPGVEPVAALQSGDSLLPLSAPGKESLLNNLGRLKSHSTCVSLGDHLLDWLANGSLKPTNCIFPQWNCSPLLKRGQKSEKLSQFAAVSKCLMLAKYNIWQYNSLLINTNPYVKIASSD